MNPTNDPLARLIEDLSSRIGNGDPITIDDVPEALRDHDAIRRLLQMARVSDLLDRNRTSDAPGPAPAAIGPWKVVRRLGAGGMGDVWLCERMDGMADQQVAVKSVRAASVRFGQRMAQERRILARLDHPNIARFIDAGTDSNGLPWMAMDYIRGVPITDWCATHDPSLETRLRLLMTVCDAVAHAHRHLVVHRDLKPANILVDESGAVKLLDFGISKLLDVDHRDTTVNALTPAYAAPEQLLGEEISTATDVYAIGLLMFRLLAGALPGPREDNTLPQVLSALDKEEAIRLSEVAASNSAMQPPYSQKFGAAQLRGDLDAITFKAIRRSPEERYDSAAALRADLQNVLQSRPVTARGPGNVYRLSRFVKRHAVWLAAAAVASLGLLIGLGVALAQAQRAEQAAQAARAEATRADAEARQAKAQAARADRAAEFVRSVFLQADPMKRDERGVITIDDAFEDALKRIDTEFADEAMLAADLNDDFAEILASKGHVDEAITRFHKALALAEQAHGRNGLAVSETLLNIAVAEAYRGQTLAGKPYLERALSILKSHPDADPLELANAHMSMSNVYSQSGDEDASRREMEASLALYTKYLPENDQRLSVVLFNTGATLHLQGDWAKAQELLEQALDAAIRLQGKDSASLLPIHDFLVSNLERLGERTRALALAREFLALADASFSGDHAIRASARQELGQQLMLTGTDAVLGERLLRDGIAMFTRLESNQTISGWRYLIGALAEQQSWENIIREQPSFVQACSTFAAQRRSACLELDALALLARIHTAPATGDVAVAEALLAEITAAEAGGEAPMRAKITLAAALRAHDRADAAHQQAEAAAAECIRRYDAEHPTCRSISERVHESD